MKSKRAKPSPENYCCFFGAEDGEELADCWLEVSPADYPLMQSASGLRAIADFGPLLHAVALAPARPMQIDELARFERTADDTEYRAMARPTPDRIASIELALAVLTSEVLCGVPRPYKDGPYFIVTHDPDGRVSLTLHPYLEALQSRQPQPH